MELNQKLLDFVYDQFYSATLDGYFVKNYEKLFEIISLTYSLLSYKNNNPFKMYFSKKDTIKLEKKFLASLNYKYKKQFSKDYKRKKVIGSGTENGMYFVDFIQNIYMIYYPSTFHIRDFELLTHEYTHHLPMQFSKRKENSNYKVYSEMLSILGELKGLDFLKNCGIPKEEIEIYKNNRLIELKTEFELFLFIEPLLKIFLTSNHFTENHISELLETNPYYKKLGKENVAYNLNWLINHNNLNTGLLSYIHPFGLIWASSLHQDNISNKDFCNLIKIINTMEIQEFEKILPLRSSIELATATKKEFSLKKIK